MPGATNAFRDRRDCEVGRHHRGEVEGNLAGGREELVQRGKLQVEIGGNCLGSRTLKVNVQGLWGKLRVIEKKNVSSGKGEPIEAKMGQEACPAEAHPGLREGG